MTRPYRWFTTEPDAYGRRAVWITWVVAMVGAAAVYAGKADDGGSAFIRWRHQVVDFWQGANIWDKYYFPNPPIFPITLTPFMWLPEVPGALAWLARSFGATLHDHRVESIPSSVRPRDQTGGFVMQDWTAGQLRYLVHFDDGGSGMRLQPVPLEVGDGLVDGGSCYRVSRVEHPKHERTFGHAWVETADL